MTSSQQFIARPSQANALGPQRLTKNGVTFQNVPGMAWIGVGVLGYLNGDRGRPVILGGQAISPLKSSREKMTP